jgi:hypothetical protein
MVTRRTTWTAYGIAGIILLAAGFWGGKSVSPEAVTPDVLAGTVRLVPGSGDSFAIQLDGSHGVTSIARWVSPFMWRDRYGNWFEDTQPACLRPRSHGQHITFGVVSVKPAGEIVPGGPVAVWIECARSPVPRYPIVTPKASGPP